MNNVDFIYDVIGVGFGPANIAVAIAMEELAFKGKVLFVESKDDVHWQENMLLENSDIQNHPLRDLVTPRNPRSKYSFTNFLFENNRLFEHLNSGFRYPLRIEYAQYIKWVGQHFKKEVKFNTKIESIELIKDKNQRDVYKLIDNKDNTYYTYTLILAPGRTPNIPKVFEHLNSPNIIHINDYLKVINSISSPQRIAVVGGSQSSIEIILHLSDVFPNTEIIGIAKTYGYKQKDVSPFTGEVYFPEFVDLFYNASDEAKQSLIQDLYLTNYSASDADILDELYKKMYIQKITNKQKIFIYRKANTIKASKTDNDQIEITLTVLEDNSEIKQNVDLIILATGFKNLGIKENEERYPKILQKVISEIEIEENDYIRINYDYSLNMKNRLATSLYLNGLCESSHGMGDAGSLSLLALRSEIIVNSLNHNLKSIK